MDKKFIEDVFESLGFSDINESGDWGIQWSEFGRDGRIKNNEKFFKTQKARDSFADKIEKHDSFNTFLAWSDPTNEEVIGEDGIFDYALISEVIDYLNSGYTVEELLESEGLDEGLKDVLNKAKKYADIVVDKMKQAKVGLGKEKELTKEMIDTFFKMLKANLAKYKSEKPTPEEVKRALFQLKQTGKVALIAALLCGPIPGDEPLIIGLEIVARKFGWSILPPSLQGII